MLDIKLLRDDIDNITIELAKRGYSLDVKKFKSLDSKRKTLQVEVEDFQSQRKKLRRNTLSSFNYQLVFISIFAGVMFEFSYLFP